MSNKYLGFDTGDLQCLLELLAEGRTDEAAGLAWLITGCRDDRVPRLYMAAQQYQDDVIKQSKQKEAQ